MQFWEHCANNRLEFATPVWEILDPPLEIFIPNVLTFQIEFSVCVICTKCTVYFWSYYILCELISNTDCILILEKLWDITIIIRVRETVRKPNLLSKDPCSLNKCIRQCLFEYCLCPPGRHLDLRNDLFSVKYVRLYVGTVNPQVIAFVSIFCRCW